MIARYRIDLNYKGGSRSVWADTARDALTKAHQQKELDFYDTAVRFRYFVEIRDGLRTTTQQVSFSRFRLDGSKAQC